MDTINDVFDVYCFYLLIYEILKIRDEFNQKYFLWFLLNLLSSALNI